VLLRVTSLCVYSDISYAINGKGIFAGKYMILSRSESRALLSPSPRLDSVERACGDKTVVKKEDSLFSDAREVRMSRCR